MNQTELQAEWDKAKAQINTVNKTKQALRAKAAAVNVPWYPKSETDAVSEQVAFDALVAASAAVSQAETAQAQAEAALTEAKATTAQTKTAEAQAVVNFRNVTAEKVGSLQRETAYYRRKLEAASTPPEPAKPPPIKSLAELSLKPDPKFDLKAFSGELGQVLSLINSAVEQNAKRPFEDPKKINPGSLGQVNNAIISAWRNQIGRAVGFWVTSLGFLGQAFGSSWHVDEAVRCFDTIVAGMVKQTGKFGGKSLTWWEFQYDVDTLRGLAPFASNPNDKEWGLSVATLMDLVHKMWASGRDDLKDRVKRGLEIVDADAQYWYYKSGRDPLWAQGARDRVIHPYAKGLIRFYQRREIAQAQGDSALVKELTGLIDDSLQKLEAEMIFYDNGKYGECLTWAYNVLGATQAAQQNDSDPYQPFVYCCHDQLLFLQLGLYGLGVFATERFQRALANSVYAGMGDKPYRTVLRNGTVLETVKTGKGQEQIYTWNDNSPVSERVTDGTKMLQRKHTYKTVGGSKRTLVTKTSADYFEPQSQVENAGAGVGLLFASPEYLDFARREFLTNNKGELSVGGTGISFMTGLALRLGMQQGLFTWS